MDRSSGDALRHGSTRLPAVVVDCCNTELRDDDGGFVGDRASKGAFSDILEGWRQLARDHGDDPLGDAPTAELGKKTLDKLLLSGGSEAAGLIHSAAEDFARALADVAGRFLDLPEWSGTEAVAIGGGMRASRVGELAIGRAAALLKAAGRTAVFRPIRHHPDEGGLVGAAHLAPSWMFAGHDALLGVDIGGTNIRAGVVELNLKRAPDLCAARVMAAELWRHRDDGPTRDEAVARIGDMLERLIRRAEKDGVALAPFIGIGCPGLICEDGTIGRGGQNLPGNWEGEAFNLPREIVARIPRIGGHDTIVVMQNDAVVQGLSELPFMRDVASWGVLTIGTGLGNARFSRPQS